MMMYLQEDQQDLDYITSLYSKNLELMKIKESFLENSSTASDSASE